MKIEPIVLEGRLVRLEPLALQHLPGLVEAGLKDPSIFRWFSEPVATSEEMRAFVEGALRDQAAGKALPFATVDRASGRIAGSTRFGNIEPPHRRVEIGWTWLQPASQRTGLNTEAKYLMLRHAFEKWGCNRVEFKTDSLNAQSRKAIARLGAQQEGIFRNHVVTASGRLRHSVYFSIINEEWPGVKERLEGLLAR